MIFLLAAVGARPQVLPTLPQATVSLAMPVQGTSTCPTYTTGSNCIRNVPQGSDSGTSEFQAAINAATCGDTIVLTAGNTYSGNFTIPATSCSGWIVIQTSALGSLPPPGNRVGPSNAANLAVISTPNTRPAIAFLPSSNHWRLIGIEITTSFSNSVSTLYQLAIMGYQSDNSTPVTVQAQLPDQIIFDRVYVYGSTVTNIRAAVFANTQAFAIVDSYCDEILNTNSDNQCIASVNGSGPFLIQNNFLQAVTENIMFGGADPSIAGLVPSDITIVGNVLQKNLAWCAPAPPYSTCTVSPAYDVKNLFELKNAQRVLFDGNVLQYTWSSAQHEAIILRSANQSGNCTWCVVKDVTVTHNVIRHAPEGIVLAVYGGTYPAVATNRILIQNNLLNDISQTNWGNGTNAGWLYEIDSGPSGYVPSNWTIDHNTGLDDQGVFANGGAFRTSSIADLYLTNDLSEYGAHGVEATSLGYGNMTGFLRVYAPGAVYKDNALTDSTGGAQGAWPGVGSCAGATGGTCFSTFADAGFTGISGTDPNYTGNFQLLSSSRYHNAGTDGKDIGVWDWTCLNHETAAALAGNFVPVPGCAVGGNLPPPPEAPTDLSATVD